MTPEDLIELEGEVRASLAGCRSDRDELRNLLDAAERNGLDIEIRSSLKLTIARLDRCERLILEALAGDDDPDARRCRMAEFIRELLILHSDVATASEHGRTIH